MLNRKILFKRPRKVEKITQFDIKQILHGFEGDILEYLPRVDLLNFEPDVIFIQEGDITIKLFQKCYVIKQVRN